MKTTIKTPITRLIATGLLALAAQSASAASVTISSTPLATAGGSSVLPNLLFVLDASGSMDSDYLGDYVDDNNKCLVRSGPSGSCTFGDPPRNAGGPTGFNGVAYDPTYNYKPGLLANGTTRITNPITVTATPNDAYGVQFTGTTNVTTSITDLRYCNANSVCLRNGADNPSSPLVLRGGTDDQGIVHPAGRFPYKAHSSNSSTAVYGLPEMMSQGNLTRSGNTVTVVTTSAHGLAVNDWIYVTGTGFGSIDLASVQVATATTNSFTYTSTASGTFPTQVTGASFTRSGSRISVTDSSHGLQTNDYITVQGTGNANIDIATPVQVTRTSADTFTYNLSGSQTVASITGNWTRTTTAASFRKHGAGTVTRVAASTTVSVNAPAHGLVNSDVVTINSTANNTVNSSNRNIAVVDADNFTYTQTGGTTTVISPGVAATWVRTGLYNVRGTVSGPANSYRIIPIEYCSDKNLTNCVAVPVGNTPPAGFPEPAYVRFCQTQEQAFTPGLVSDASGTPRCRGKWVGSGTTLWTYPRYGYFQRDIIQTGTTFTRSTTRTDCVGAPTCTYTEEIQNYARWWAYYRTRMQMMKTAAGRAFLPFISNPSATPAIPDKLRIGFITINPFYAIGSGTDSGSVQANRWLKIDGFNTTHATNWYNMFYLQDPNQSTPLREALSRAGWIYSGKMNTGLTAGIPNADDPVLASCQRHFTLLTTDGYWNGNTGDNLQGGSVGNLDNQNPIVDSGYALPSVDRTTTGTFDGGVGTVVTVATPTTQTEQVICYSTSNTAFTGGTQQACGCAAGQHRIKQRVTTTTPTVTTTDGVQTGSSPGTPTYTFSNITVCSSNYVVTNTTPANRLEQQVCTGAGNTTFSTGNGPCGCPANLKRVKQQTGDRNHVVVTTDGAPTSDTYSAYTYTRQDITACNALVVSTATPRTEVEEVLCNGNANTAFSVGANTGAGGFQQACGCPTSPGSGDRRRIRRTLTYTNTAVTHDGAATSNTNSAYTLSGYTSMAGCTPTVATTTYSNVTVTQDAVCAGTGSVTLTDGTVVTCTCSTGRRFRVHQQRTGASSATVTTNGATTSGPTAPSGGTNGLTYCTGTCNSWPTNFSSTKPSGTGCSNSGSGSVFTTIPQNINYGTGTTVTTGITALVLSPNPTTTSGASTPTSSGATVTSADFTLTPNPQINDPSGATVSTPAGTQLTIALTPNPSIPTAGSSTTTTTLGGYTNTLADVAMYYYRTDLRGGSELHNSGLSTGPTNNLGGTGTTDVSQNIVPARAGSKDFATHQHMVTFAVGMADGLMRYQADYELAATGDFANIKAGTANGCFWVTGTCNWPQPVNDDASALDDLWHAAVNGRGQFYLATNADALSTGIQTALTAVNAQVAAAAASATSSPNVTQTDNQIFSTTYETNTWSGKVFSQTIDPDTGNVNPTIQWQADQQLLAKVAAATDTRVIWTFDATAGTKLKTFDWASLTATEQAFFLNKCVPASTMTQCTGLTTGQATIANDGSSLVGYLRGHLGNEITIFRDRTFIDVNNNNAVVQTVLGDTISAKPAYLRRPQFNYADAVTPAYSSFLSGNTNRSPRVYVAANDGYLHAFHGDTGEEMWAYLPRFLMPGLYALADTGYASLHRYFADGSPETGEIYDTVAGAWKSILVAGVSGGGRGFYALDITDPSNPKGLWEFCSEPSLCAISDADLGLSFGNAVIGKRALDGKWVVVVSSGLNNVGPGDGIGYFYVLDAITGAVLHKVATTAGSGTTPSGLMKISAAYDSALTDATFRYAYSGDQLGNVWRLDTSTNPPTVLHIAQLTDGSTPPREQPLTTRVRLTKISGNTVMFIGTGRYLGSPDLSDPGAGSGISWQQTMWAFKDKGTDYGNLRNDGNLVQQVLTQATLGATTRTISSNPVDWNTKDGWYVDFNPLVGGVGSSPGEGVNLVDPVLVQGTVHVVTNVPAAGGSSCSVGGSSFEYGFDFKTGQAVSTSAGGVVGRSLGGTITVGVAIVQLPSGAIKAISTGADTSKTTSAVNVSAAGAAVRRFSYRVR